MNRSQKDPHFRNIHLGMDYKQTVISEMSIGERIADRLLFQKCSAVNGLQADCHFRNIHL